MTERRLGPLKASDTELMPTTTEKWVIGDLTGMGGGFELAVSNSEPTLMLTVTFPDGAGTVVERVDVTPLLNQWVHAIVRERVELS